MSLDDHPITLLLRQNYPVIKQLLPQLRFLILTDGLPKESKYLRSRVWSILTQTNFTNATKEYANLLDKCSDEQIDDASSYHIIKSDVSNDIRKRKDNSSYESFIRILNCYFKDTTIEYQQGMYIFLEPILNIFPAEPMALSFFKNLCNNIVPMYIISNSIGVRNGAKLLDQCLSILDPELLKYFHERLLTPEIYASTCIFSLFTCLKPIEEVHILWDFMFAYGFHLNILIIISIMKRHRKDIMKISLPINFLQNYTLFDCNTLIKDTVSMLPSLDDKLYSQLVDHIVKPDIF